MSAPRVPADEAAYLAGYADAFRDIGRGYRLASEEAAAERAKLRRWQLRLRWRNDPARGLCVDRLFARTWLALSTRGGVTRYRHTPIAGPRGVLP